MIYEQAFARLLFFSLFQMSMPDPRFILRRNPRFTVFAVYLIYTEMYSFARRFFSALI